MGRAEDRRARQQAVRRASKPHGIRRFFTWKKLLGTFFGLCLLGMGGFLVLYLIVPVPGANADAKKQSNVYKYSNGKVLARTGEVNREIVGVEDIPKDVKLTFVAAENMSFYDDAGIDFKGTARGLLNTLSGKGKQGGSTITQQYVKNYYLTQDQTVSRKLRELVISLKVDRQKSKDEILLGYINTSYYGRGAFGIQAAAQAYYGVDASRLSLTQGAYLAALLQAPSQYDWAVASDTSKRLVKERWAYVLNNMVRMGEITAAERDEQKFDKPQKPKPAPGLEGQTGYLVKAANQQLEAAGIDEELLAAGGWTITLNIEEKKQKQLEKAVEAELTSKLDPKERKVDANVQAGAVSVNPKNGAVVALYGGRDYVKHEYSNAKRSDYQPASTFKPLIFASALENGSRTQDDEPITASTVYDGDSRRPVVGSDIPFAPPNEDEVDYGDVNVQFAMNKSVNSVFAQMGVDVGMERVLETAGDLGMDTEDLEAVPAQTLGSMGASPWQMAGVYATLDNHGRKVTPSIVKEVTSQTRQAPDLGDPIGEQVISREAADSVTSVLTGVVDDGTGAAVRSARYDVAGKTGTSDDNKSAWFTGYTPDLVTSVGLFGESATENGKQVTLSGAAGGGRVNGGGFPAEIWAAYMFGVLGDKTSEFDLETDMGAAVAPTAEPTTESPSASVSPSQSESPEVTETPDADPTTTAPETTAPTTTPPETTAPTTTPPETTPGGQTDSGGQNGGGAQQLLTP
ncbi:transglycosylase domain-containing protein [Streptomyces sp. GC420]|uniref:transglycosylase domain-containing protein n=1 Tax=Streptomyces sp. GC420 TaxID=2697568 RepID=UPI00141506DB|nr:transglycosylase domain-containing protein [Streptomyces sp. GC420]NBM16589.1 penicillin-binding protein [Streptomyces sp. GC420]